MREASTGECDICFTLHASNVVGLTRHLGDVTPIGALTAAFS